MALPPNARVIAEGDSWFDYPPRQLYTEEAQGSPGPGGYEANRRDVLKCLKAEHNYNIESVAVAADRVEDMAYGGPQHAQLAELEVLISQDPTPAAVLLSGGGNDLVAVDGGELVVVCGEEVELPGTGTTFGMLLNHARSALVLAGQNELNESVVSGVIDQRLRDAYITMLTKVTEVSKHWHGKPLPILVHGYDYPVPDGSVTTFQGPQFNVPPGSTVQVGGVLGPAFAAKGYGKVEVRTHTPPVALELEAEQLDQLRVRIAVMKQLVDRFNAMLQDVADLAEFAHVRYVDLRHTLSTELQGDRFYQTYWENEFHPTECGFRRIALRFHEALQQLG